MGDGHGLGEDGAGGHTGPDDPGQIAADTDWSTLVDDLWWAGTDLDATLERVAQRASRLLDASSAVFVTEDGQLAPRAFWDDDEQRRATIRRLFDRGPAPADSGQFGQVLRGGQPILVTAAREGDPLTHFHGYISESRLSSYLILPLVAHHETLGLLAVGRHADQPPIDAAAQATAERLAQRAAHLVRIAALVEHLRVADTALAAMSEAVVATDMQGKITFWNNGAERIYGWPAHEAVGHPVSDVLQPGASDIGERQARVQGAMETDGRWAGRAEQSRRDGTRVTVDCVTTWLRDQQGNHAGGVLVCRDVSSEVALSSQLSREQALARAALDSSPMLTAVADHDGVLLATSRGWAERLGPAAPVGCRVSDAALRLLPDTPARTRFLESFTAIVADLVPRTQDDYDVATSEGDATFSVHLTRVPDVGATITIADITDRVSRERALTYTAGHDAVTQLPNRTVFMDRAVHALNRAARQHTQVGLLFCDLDAFKDLNDSYGHGVGDEVLEEFGDRLVQSCRSSDTVARLGGDEFVVLLEDGVDDAAVAQVAQRVIAGAALPLQVPSAGVSVTTSVGAVVVTPEPDSSHGDGDVDAMLAKADAAMYEAKRRGKNRWVMFDPSIQAQHVSRGAFLGEHPAAASADDFQLFFQPQFDVAGQLRGAEALLRWLHHPDRGPVEPFDVAHHNGALPVAVGDWVLGQAAATLHAWLPALPDGFRMGVNLSPGQWLDRATTDTLLNWLDRVDVPLTKVRVELPQDAIVVDLEHSRAVTRQLAEAGIDVAVNGFGMGSAPLTDIVGLTVGTAVLGRGLVRSVGRVDGADRLLRGVVQLCRQLEWQVIATGVETEEQLAATHGAGCSIVQGSMLGRPVAADQFAAEYLALPGSG